MFCKIHIIYNIMEINGFRKQVNFRYTEMANLQHPIYNIHITAANLTMVYVL